MKAKVLMFAPNGNDLVCHYKDMEKVSDHVYFYSENDGLNDYYELVLECNGNYFEVTHVYSKERLSGVTIESVISIVKDWIEHNEYFNKAWLAFLREYSEELYEKAIRSRIECLRLRELEDKKRAEMETKRRMEEEEKKRIEKERNAAEAAARKFEKEKFFQDNKDILIENITSFQKLTAFSELTKLYRFDGEIKTYLLMIRTEGFIKKYCYIRNYSTRKRNLCYAEFKKPIRECLLTNGEVSYKVPAKLYDVLKLEEVKK